MHRACLATADTIGAGAPPAQLATARGPIAFPAYVPVITFGKKYPLDKLIAPYLQRLAPAVMVSAHYARQMTAAERPARPLLVDSGGYAALFAWSRVVEEGALGAVEIAADRPEGTSERIDPQSVLEFQEGLADVAFTLDFPIPPALDRTEAERRQRLTIANALWAIANRRRRDMPLYACVQGWDAASYRACAQAYEHAGFDGVAIGGLVPRAQQPDEVLAIVDAVRAALPALPLHVFGLGRPELVATLYARGVQSVDSSSYVKLAADGRRWDAPDYVLTDASPAERMQLALCNLACATRATLPLSAARLVLGARAGVPQSRTL